MRFQTREIPLPAKLLVFSCVHFDDPGHDGKLFGDFLDQAKERNTYTLGLGDYMSFARASLRMGLQKAQPDEDSGKLLDLMAADAAEVFIRRCRNSLGQNCLGFVTGNHHWTFLSTDKAKGFYAGQTTDEYICSKLGISYFGWLAFIRLELSKGSRSISKTLVASHMYQGSSQAGGDLNTLLKKSNQFSEVDMVFAGHTHRRIPLMEPKLAPNASFTDVVEKPRLVYRVGSFLKGYLPNEETYVSKKLLSPLDRGWAEVSWDLVNKQGDPRLETTVSMRFSEKI